jgi:hypothetical protein
MAYFNELPNVEVVSRFPNQSSNQDYITIKNLWRRAKIREDALNAATAFQYYQIEGDERPDQIAEKFYGDPELDWVILITNNIINFNEDWPLTGNSLHNYLIDKYGTEEALQEIRYTETDGDRDQFDRLVIPKGLQVDPELQSIAEFTVAPGDDGKFILSGFPSEEPETRVIINLIQVLYIDKRNEEDLSVLIPDIQIETSNLKVYIRDETIADITVTNDLANFWPSSWGGSLTVIGRTENTVVNIDDILSDEFKVVLPKRLYEIKGEVQDGEIVPTFEFTYVPGG